MHLINFDIMATSGCNIKGMKASILILTGIIAVAVLTSCKTYIYIPKHYAPEIAPEAKPVTIVFINNFNYHDPGIVREKHHGTYERAISGFTRSFARALSADDSIKVVIGDTLRKETAAGMLTTLLPIETIADNCSRYDAGMLIALDSLFVGFDSMTDYVESIRFVNIYSRRFYLFAEFFLSAYNPAGDLLNRSSVDRTFYYSWRMAITQGAAFDPSVAGASRKIDKVSIPCGEDYVQKFYPLTESVSRQINTGTPFTESNNLMKSGRWEEAVKRLEVLAGSSDKTMAKKAEMNLAVAKEGAGR